MKIDRIMGVILFVLILSFFALKHSFLEEDKSNPFELIGDNGYISENVVNYKEKVFNGNNSSTEIIEYTNTYNYPVEIKANDIAITCTGVGESKERDEALAEANYKITAAFSESKNGDLYNSLMVPKKAKIYIHLTSEYKGEMPENKVSCEYNINISSN